MEMIIITVKTLQNKKAGHLTLLMKQTRHQDTVTICCFISTFSAKDKIAGWVYRTVTVVGGNVNPLRRFEQHGWRHPLQGTETRPPSLCKSL